MILAIQGTPGSGKSSIMVADMAEFLLSGGVVAMNFSLSPDWLDTLCAASYKYSSGRVDRDLFRRSLYERCFKVGSHETVLDLGKQLRQLTRLKGREGVGRLYIDEAQLLFNSRSWKDNQGYIEFFTQHRKLGWDVWLVTHTLDMIDKQIRGLVELETRLRNLQKVKLFGVVPLAWKPVFVAITRYAGISAGAGEIYSRRLYPLNPSYKDLYDTCEVFAFAQDNAPREYGYQGEYTPAPSRPALWDLMLKLLARFIPTAPVRPFHTAAPASVWPQYHETVKSGTAAPPGGVSAPLVARSWSRW